MRSLSFIRIMFVLALSSLCVMAQAQSPGSGAAKPETPSRGSITGRVVNESGEPLQNAIVTLSVVGRVSSDPGVATDREGNFQFEGLEPNTAYYVNAAMPAYTSLPREPGANQTPKSYRAGDSVTITLTKGGVITGRVTNANGDPLVAIRVRAEMVVRARNGRRLLNGWAIERETDDRGVYRIYGLLAGTYVVMAGGVRMSYSSANVDPFDTDVPTFAPSSTRETASEISVRSGEEISNIDITHRGEQGRLISGTVDALVGENEGFNVILTPVGDGIASWSGHRFPEMNGRSFSFVGLGEGEYDLYAHSYSKTREYGISDIKRVRVRGADVTGIELTPRPLATVAGRVVLEEANTPECTDKSRPSFEGITVGGWHNDTEAAKQIPSSVWSMGAPVKPDAQGNFLVRNLAPGEYYFAPRVTAKNWYVRSIQFASAQKKPIDATRVWTNLKSADRLSGLVITLAPGGGSFSGQLSLGEGEPVPARTFVYLAPVERERAENTLSYFGTPVASEGKFAINNIAPGRYWIFTQTVAEDAPAPLSRIRFPHETETRAQLRREAEAAKTEIEFKPCQNVENYKLPLER
jgi:hypothetical protein